MRRMIGAAVQFSLEPMDVRANLEKAEGRIDACVRESRADLVVRGRDGVEFAAEV